MNWRVSDSDVDPSGLGERLCKKSVKHTNRTGRMLWIIVDGGSTCLCGLVILELQCSEGLAGLFLEGHGFVSLTGI